tara:strand:- start:5839 stop:5952 length:114 start_codon:yes stop_codon:yes gene_type:complete
MSSDLHDIDLFIIKQAMARLLVPLLVLMINSLFETSL